MQRVRSVISPLSPASTTAATLQIGHISLLDTGYLILGPAQPGDYARGVSANREMSGVRAAITSY